MTEELLKLFVERILQTGFPQKIILFGSHARKDASSSSDVDLLIIEESDLPRYKRAPKYLCALVGLYPSKDVVVWTPEEVERWRSVPNSFIASALEEGVVLYARQP